MPTRALVYWIALVGGVELMLQGHLGDETWMFHAGAWTVAGLLGATAWRRRGVRGAQLGALAVVPALLSLLAWAEMPPRPPNPLADFWRAHEAERQTLAKNTRRSALTLFGETIQLDRNGFRRPRPEPARDPFRIVAIGGSTTFGATTGEDDLPWPARLAQRIASLDCARPVVVVNAGRVGRGLGGALARFEREIAPLAPDHVVFYPAPQDVADMLVEIPRDAAPRGAVPPRASELLRRLELAWRGRGAERRFREALATDLPALDLDAVSLAPTYRRLVLDLRRQGIDVSIATASLAVNGDTSEDTVRRHEALEFRTRRLVLANRFLAHFLRGLAASYRARLIDTRPGLDGAGDEAFLDLFHLNPTGRERLAARVFEGLRPVLRRPDPGCEGPADR